MSSPTGHALEQQVDALYSLYTTTRSPHIARLWVKAAKDLERVRYRKHTPARMTPEQEAQRQRFARVPAHRCRRCGISTTRAIWCTDCDTTPELDD